MAYENYAGGILVICIEILSDYCFVVLAANNEPFRVTPPSSSG